MRVCFAIAVGFLFVTIFYRGGSLLPCIIVHSAINTLSTFSNKAGNTVEKHIIHVLVLMFITVAYNLVLTKTLPKSQLANNNDTRDPRLFLQGGRELLTAEIQRPVNRTWKRP